MEQGDEVGDTCGPMKSRAELRRDIQEDGKGGESTVQSLSGGEGPRSSRGGVEVTRRASALLRTAWWDPEGVAPGWAGSAMPEPGQGRGHVACQGLKNGVSVLLIRTVAPGQDAEEASIARLAEGCSQCVTMRTLDGEPHL